MHQYRGKLIIHTGSMFSGKTSSLEKEIKRFKIAGYKTLAFKPTLDTRHAVSDIITHDKTSIEAILVEDIYDIQKKVKTYEPQVIGIDEIQFLAGDVLEIRKIILEFLKMGITVVVAGLDMDFSAEPFEVLKELMPISDYLTKHHAVCVNCGTDAWVSHRKTASKERVVIGAQDEYEPLCRTCYTEACEKEAQIINKNQIKIEDLEN
ncbi:MAG: thymidine kinase [Tissierellia bacterium]|nr:thymidine kinase [Tissierellia bacterium]